MNDALWIWSIGLLAFIGFNLWYNNWRGPLSAAEISKYTDRLKTRLEEDGGSVDDENGALIEFVTQDDGKEFYMLNLIQFPNADVVHPDTGARREPMQLLMEYFKPFMVSIFSRAGHPVLSGPIVGGYIEAWNVETNPGWSGAGLIRYRSRRDFLELALNPHFDSIHIFKRIALQSTFATPFQPNSGLAMSPRIWIGLVIALLSASLHIAIV